MFSFFLNLPCFPFQFQFGAIKRIIKTLFSDETKEFQFQFGAIKREQKNKVFLVADQFQFQFGAIKRARASSGEIPFLHFNSSLGRLRGSNSNTSRPNESISIPVWCD